MSAKKTLWNIRKHITRYHAEIILILLVTNTLLLVVIAVSSFTQIPYEEIITNQKREELWGQKNYDRYQKIIHSKEYQQQQTFLLNQKYKQFFPNESIEKPVQNKEEKK